jgi:hypothetical protein
MSVQSLVDEVIKHGGTLTLKDDGGVRYRLPEDAAHLVGELRAHKPELIEFLRQAALAQPVEPARCAHCEGKGECDCPACNLRRTDKAVPCSMCRWQERQVWLAATRPRECWFCEERRLHGAGGLCSNCEAKPVGVQ